MAAPSPVVFLLDVDNTLIDNDRVAADLKRYLRREVGPESESRYWAIFEDLRAELGYADYLGALQRYRVDHPRDPHLLAVSSFLVNYPFANRLFPGSLDVLEHLAAFGPTVILSDGDVVFQPQGRALGALRRGRRPRPNLHPQGARARRRRGAFSRGPLRAHRRQAPHPDRGQGALG